MNKTPETKTPTRAEALAALKMIFDIFESHCENMDIDMPDDEDAALLEGCKAEIEAALATDAPIVEGVDKAIKKVEAHFRDEDGTVYGWVKPVTDAARLYAQGRTQSEPEWIDKAIAAIQPLQRECFADSHAGLSAAVSVHSALEFLKAAKLCVQDRPPSAVLDGYKVVPIEPDENMRLTGENYRSSHVTVIYQKMLSAAPPVTGGARVDSLQRELADYKKLVSEDDHSMTIVAKENMEKLRDLLSKIRHEVDERECQWFWRRSWINKYTREALALLPTPPSSQTRGG